MTWARGWRQLVFLLWPINPLVSAVVWPNVGMPRDSFIIAVCQQEPRCGWQHLPCKMSGMKSTIEPHQISIFSGTACINLRPWACPFGAFSSEWCSLTPSKSSVPVGNCLDSFYVFIFLPFAWIYVFIVFVLLWIFEFTFDVQSLGIGTFPCYHAYCKLLFRDIQSFQPSWSMPMDGRCYLHEFVQSLFKAIFYVGGHHHLLLIYKCHSLADLGSHGICAEVVW